MVAQDHFEGYPSNLVYLGIIGHDDHSLFHRGSAGGKQFFLLLNLDEAYPAHAFRAEARTMA
jgi:hypothetical protein